jgi:hypothetical protein
VRLWSNPQVFYFPFDFHEECKNNRYENLTLLLNQVQTKLGTTSMCVYVCVWVGIRVCGWVYECVCVYVCVYCRSRVCVSMLYCLFLSLFLFFSLSFFFALFVLLVYVYAGFSDLCVRTLISMCVLSLFFSGLFCDSLTHSLVHTHIYIIHVHMHTFSHSHTLYLSQTRRATS